MYKVIQSSLPRVQSHPVILASCTKSSSHPGLTYKVIHHPRKSSSHPEKSSSHLEKLSSHPVKSLCFFLEGTKELIVSANFFQLRKGAQMPLPRTKPSEDGLPPCRPEVCPRRAWTRSICSTVTATWTSLQCSASTFPFQRFVFALYSIEYSLIQV